MYLRGTFLNCTDAVRDLLMELINQTRPTEPPLSQEDRDRHAILYIVVVLLFYSIGIVIAIIMYLKRERNEAEEEKAFDDYMNFRQDPEMLMRYHRVQSIVGQLQEVEQRQQQRQQKQQNKSSFKKHREKSKLKFQLSWGSKETEILDKAKKTVPSGSSKSLEQQAKNLTEPTNPAVERSLSWGGRENKRESGISYKPLDQTDNVDNKTHQDNEIVTPSGHASSAPSVDACTLESPGVVVGPDTLLPPPVVVVNPSDSQKAIHQL